MTEASHTRASPDPGSGLTGSDAERRAANHLATRLRDEGFEAAAEPIFSRPEWSSSYALHALGGLLASLVVVASPLAGTILAFGVAVSMLAEVALGTSPLRLLTPRRASQNVVTAPSSDPERPTILIVAACDRPRAARLAPGPLLSALITGPLVGLFVVAGLRLLDVGSGTLAGVQFAFSAGLIVLAALLLESRVAGVEPGATSGDRAVEVAVELRRGDRDIDVRVLLAGSAARTPDGGRAFVSAHGEEFDPAHTVVIEILAVGRTENGGSEERVSGSEEASGAGYYLEREGPLGARVPTHALGDTCREAGLEPWRTGGQGTAAALAARGFQAVAVSIDGPEPVIEIATRLYSPIGG